MSRLPFDANVSKGRHGHIMRERLGEDLKALVESVTLMFVATVDADGRLDVSPKGGTPGFVQVLDRARLAWGEVPGNRMYMTGGNLTETGRAGVCIFDPFTATILRVNGTAELVPGDMEGRFPGAEYCVVLTAEEIFPNCGRSLKPFQEQLFQVMGQAIARMKAGGGAGSA